MEEPQKQPVPSQVPSGSTGSQNATAPLAATRNANVPVQGNPAETVAAPQPAPTIPPGVPNVAAGIFLFS